MNAKQKNMYLPKHLRCALIGCFSLLLVISMESVSHAQQVSAAGHSLDARLRALLRRHQIEPLNPGPAHAVELVELGQALFFDRELSGNRDTSCATCHHPQLATGDSLALPVGTKPQTVGTLGSNRILGDDREYVPRNAPEIFNRGSTEWTSMFWDSRVADDGNGGFINPAGEDLLPGLDSLLSVQAMFPVTSRDEMRGRIGDMDINGNVNEMGQFEDSDLHGMWDALMVRILSFPGYQKMFANAYPGVPQNELTFAHAAKAIGAFEADAYTYLDSPFDLYLEGEDSALNNSQKRGAILFYGSAGCVRCHSGPLMTDQNHWAIAAPQLGPGKGEFAPFDVGRYLQNEDNDDLFAFRTPPLRNVAATGPWLHNGAYSSSLKDVIRHHARPLWSLLTYDPEEQLSQFQLRPTVMRDPFTFFLLAVTLDRRQLPRNLSRGEINLLEDFLQSLTAPNLESRLLGTIPDSVPSGLEVERLK